MRSDLRPVHNLAELPAMKILASLTLVLSSAIVVLACMGADAPDRPPGVDSSHWVSLGTSTGVVLTSGEDEPRTDNGERQKPDPPMVPYPQPDRTLLFAPTSPVVEVAIQHAEAQEPMHGYLMVKQAGIWRRLVVTTH
jgi:hypothetical protein